MMSNNEKNIINLPTEPAPRPNAGKKEHSSNNEDNIINFPSFTKEQKIQSDKSSDKGLLEKTREIIHMNVATDEELMKEKPALDRLKANMPSSAKEAIDMAKNTLLKDNTKKEQENAETYSPFEHEKGDGRPIEAVRSKLYEVTKSAEVKEREEFENKPLKERIQHLHEKGSGMPKEQDVGELLSSVWMSG